MFPLTKPHVRVGASAGEGKSCSVITWWGNNSTCSSLKRSPWCMVRKFLDSLGRPEIPESHHCRRHLFCRCFIDCGVAGGGGCITSLLRGHIASCFHFPPSSISLIHPLAIWSHGVRRTHIIKNYFSCHVSEKDKKPACNASLDAGKPNTSGNQPFGLELNSPFCNHSILNTTSTPRVSSEFPG